MDHQMKQISDHTMYKQIHGTVVVISPLERINRVVSINYIIR